MPDAASTAACVICGANPEALAGVRLCRPCLEAAHTVLRTLLAADACKHVTAAFLRDWAVGAVPEVKELSPMAHLLRGVVQGLMLAEEVIPDGPERGPLISMEMAAMQALQEARG